MLRILLISMLLLSACATSQPSEQSTMPASSQVEKLTALAEQGDPKAKHKLGYLYYEGRGVPKDAVIAYMWWRLASDQGYKQSNIAMMKLELAEAITDVERRVAIGRAIEWRAIHGYTYFDRGEYAKAFETLKRPADLGYIEAQYLIGLMYHQGKGVAEDDSEAVKYFRLAANRGHEIAQAYLGDMFYTGSGTRKNLKAALRFYKLSAEKGFAPAQHMLSIMYREGEGTVRDYGEALKWTRAAAEQGLAEAQVNLGTIYSLGEGVPVDEGEAAKWYRLAADQGLADAQYNLGFMYQDGLGVTKDYVEALKWLLMAEANGHQQAAQLAREISERMTEAQIVEAKRLAGEREESKVLVEKSPAKSTPDNSIRADKPEATPSAKQPSPTVKSIVVTSALDDRNNPVDTLVEVDRHSDFYVQVRWRNLEPGKRYFVSYFLRMNEEIKGLGTRYFTPTAPSWRTWIRAKYPPQIVGTWTLNIELDSKQIAARDIVIGVESVADASAIIERNEPLFSKGPRTGSSEYGDCLLPGDTKSVTQRENLCLAAGGEFKKRDQKPLFPEKKPNGDKKVAQEDLAPEQRLEEILAAAERGDLSTVLRLATALAGEGVADAQAILGLMYLEGKGVETNYAEAMKWFRLAADQELADAQYALGVMYAKGLGVAKDEGLAFKWYRLAADQGHGYAQAKVDLMYAEGDGECRLPGDTKPVTLKKAVCLAAGGKYGKRDSGETVPGVSGSDRYVIHSRYHPTVSWQGLDATVEELQRFDQVSVFRLRRQSPGGTEGALGRFFMCAMVRVTTERGFSSFVNAVPTNDDHVVIFLKKNEKAIEGLLPTEYADVEFEGGEPFIPSPEEFSLLHEMCYGMEGSPFSLD